MISVREVAVPEPRHSGRAVSYDVTHAFIDDAYGALAPRGRLVLVANRFLAYDRAMMDVFGNVMTLAETPQYRVLRAERIYRRKRGDWATGHVHTAQK